MSIVITVVDFYQKHVYMMGDKRAIRNGVINDSYQKIFNITDTLFLGITGIAEYGEIIHQLLLQNQPAHPSHLIEMVRLFIKSNPVPSYTCTIAGLYDDGEAFSWVNSDNDREGTLHKGEANIKYHIASNSTDLFDAYFQKEFLATNRDIIRTMDKTIEYASTIDSSISNSWNLLQVREQ